MNTIQLCTNPRISRISRIRTVIPYTIRARTHTHTYPIVMASSSSSGSPHSIETLLKPYTHPQQQWIVSTGIYLFEQAKPIHRASHAQDAQDIPHPQDSQDTHAQQLRTLETTHATALSQLRQQVETSFQQGKETEQARTRYQVESLQHQLDSARKTIQEIRESAYKDGQQSILYKVTDMEQTIHSLKSERDQLDQSRRELTTKLVTERQALVAQLQTQYESQFRERIDQLRTELAQEKQDKHEIVAMRQEMLDQTRTHLEQQYQTHQSSLEQTIQSLESQVQRYQDLYESTGKGIEYEKVVFDKMLEYNDKHLGNQWEITHVGQMSGGGKGDILMTHRHLGTRVLIDLKNKNEVGKQDIQKFLKDVQDPTNKCDIGLLIARGRIYTKQPYHVDHVNNQAHMYMANFKIDHIGMIFTSLDMACEWQKTHNTAFNKEEYRNHLHSMYTFFQSQQKSMMREADKMSTKMTEVGDLYFSEFSAQIEMDIRETKERKQNHAQQHTQNAQNAQVLCSISTDNAHASHMSHTSHTMNDLEEGRTVVGKRSKHILLYVEKGEPKTHYFRGKSEMKKKQDKLSKQQIEWQAV